MGLAFQLRLQLTVMGTLCRRMLERQGPARDVAFGELVQHAVAFLSVHRQLLLPALRARQWKSISSDFLVATIEFQRSLAELLAIGPLHSEFMDAAAAFDSRLSAVSEMHERVLVPALHGLGLDEESALVGEVAAAFDLPPRTAAPLDTAPAAAVIAEAAVVLPVLLGLLKQAAAET